MLTSIRARFNRGEEVKYISHLDLMKAFERGIRRAKIPIAYSQGFNPHPQMVFGLPLPVGVTSEAEYADFELSEPMDPRTFLQKLNAQLPRGIEIAEAGVKTVKTNIMASVASASYEVIACMPADTVTDNLKTAIDDFISRSEIITAKETKSGKKDIDIRPMIFNLSLSCEGSGNDAQSCLQHPNRYISNYLIMLENSHAYYSEYRNSSIICLSMALSAGSAANLKPELLLGAFGKYSGYDLEIIKIHRTGLFTGTGNNVPNPLNAALTE